MNGASKAFLCVYCGEVKDKTNDRTGNLLKSGVEWGKVEQYGENLIERGAKMFLGEYTHSIDAKGRLIVPSKFREDLSGSAVLTKGLDGCLFLFPKKEWEILSQKLSQLPLARQEARSFTRFFFSSATEVELDKQGRIAIPQHLQQFAGIDKNIQVIGMNSRVELWASEHWAAFQDTSEESFEQLAELMATYDIGI